jgi:hypothetical protein
MCAKFRTADYPPGSCRATSAHRASRGKVALALITIENPTVQLSTAGTLSTKFGEFFRKRKGTSLAIAHALLRNAHRISIRCDLIRLP